MYGNKYTKCAKFTSRSVDFIAEIMRLEKAISKLNEYSLLSKGYRICFFPLVYMIEKPDKLMLNSCNTEW